MAEQTVKMTRRPWSEEVARADPDQRQRKEVAYEFSGGRKFESTDAKGGGPYAQP